MPINPGVWLELVIYGIIAWMIIAVGKMLIESTPFYAKRIANKNQGQNAAPQESSKPKTSSEEETTKGEPLNLVLMIVVLISLIVFVRIKVGFELNGTPTDYPAMILAIVPIVLLALLFIFNLIEWARGIKKVRRWGHKSETNELSKEALRKIDRNRKIFHLIAMGLLFMALAIMDHVLKTTPDKPAYAELYANFWGSKDGLGYLEIAFVRHSIPIGQSLMIFWMYGTVLLLLTFEITRLSNHWHFLLHREVQGWLRYKEIDTFAAFTHFGVGYLFAAIILPPLLFLASMCLITFADPAASTIGIKWGKHRFSWNKKSWEGLIAGTVLAFVTMFPFVGLIYSLLGAIAFGFIDLLTPKPIAVSDNMAMPLVITGVFVLLSLLGIPCQNYFGF